MTEAGPEDISREAMNRIQRFVDYRPRTAFEVRRKLKSLGYESRVSEEVISCLVEQGVLDDERFVAAYTEELLRKRYGYKRIIAELLKKGIGREDIEKLKQRYPYDTEIERAKEACLSRFNISSSDENRESRSKILGYLLRRGFQKEIAEKATRSLTG